MSTLGAQTKMMDDTKSVGGQTRASTHKTSGTTRSISSKLNTMADDFNNFYGDLEEETTIRKQAEEQRVINMEAELVKIEKVLATETKRRIEAGKALRRRRPRYRRCRSASRPTCASASSRCSRRSMRSSRASSCSS